MQKYFKFSLKKYAQITLGFLAICKEKKYIYIFSGFVWQKPNFSCNKTTQNRLKGCLSKTSLNPKKPL
jgi:hypothetical protein